MNKYQRVLNQLVKNDVTIPWDMSFRKARSIWKENLKTFDSSLGFLYFMKANQDKGDK